MAASEILKLEKIVLPFALTTVMENETLLDVLAKVDFILQAFLAFVSIVGLGRFTADRTQAVE